MSTFKIDASALRVTLAAVRPAVDPKGSRPIMGYVQIVVANGKAQISADKGDVAMMAKCEADGAAGFVVPYDKFAQIAGLYDEALTMTYNAAKRALTIKAKRAEHVVTCADPADWAPIDWSVKAHTAAQAPAPVILSAAGWAHLWSAHYYVAQDVNRVGLNGLFLERVGDGETLRTVGTDGSRLCWRSAVADPTIPISGADLPSRALVPSGVAAVLGKSAAIAQDEDLFALTLGERAGVWAQVDADGEEVGALRVRFALLEGTFPDYRMILPGKVKRTATVNCSDWSTALKSVAVSATDKNASVRCDFEAGRLRMSARDVKGGEARADLPAEVDGGDISVGLNAIYVASVISGMAGDSVTVHLGDALDPTIWVDQLWRPASGSLADLPDMVIIMPMRLD